MGKLQLKEIRLTLVEYSQKGANLSCIFPEGVQCLIILLGKHTGSPVGRRFEWQAARSKHFTSLELDKNEC